MYIKTSIKNKINEKNTTNMKRKNVYANRKKSSILS